MIRVTHKHPKTRKARSGNEYRDCTSKQRYADYNKALYYAKILEEKRGKPLDCYFCHYCGGYHLTSHTEVKKKGENKWKAKRDM